MVLNITPLNMSSFTSYEQMQEPIVLLSDCMKYTESLRHEITYLTIVIAILGLIVLLKMDIVHIRKKRE